MKKFLTLVLSIAISLASLGISADVWVNGYTRSDGTQVQGHYRSSPNGTVTDNYSFRGNINPRTGAVGTNRYRNNPSSPYYNGGTGYRAPQPYRNNYGIGNTPPRFNTNSAPRLYSPY